MALVCIILFATGFAFGWLTRHPKNIEVEKEVIKTVEVPVEKIVYKEPELNIPSEGDTIKVEVKKPKKGATKKASAKK